MGIESSGSLILWIVFGIIVVVSLAIDLGVHNHHHGSSTKEAAIWSAIWIGLAVVFGLGVSPFIGGDRTLDYFTAYLLEKSLSVDNLFVFLVIFSFFQIPKDLQRRVLFWGILGALAMRAIFIFVGVALLSKFHVLFYVFGAFLIYTGAKLLFSKHEDVHPEKNFAYRLVRKLFRVSDDISSEHFFTIENGKRVATRLLVVLVVIEATDVVFAVDSIPAVLAVTTDTFVVYTSNIFAILGLRALYFLLAGVMGKFRYLNVGLAFVLAFIGVKMVVVDWFKVPPLASLIVVSTLLTASIVASVIADRREKALPEAQEPPPEVSPEAHKPQVGSGQ
ncbi:MAG: TerC family protein [Myxococcales bacterium]|jgi:tellurite resistance protein TerC